MPILITYNL